MRPRLTQKSAKRNPRILAASAHPHPQSAVHAPTAQCSPPGRFTDDPLDTFGTKAVVQVPRLPILMRYICRNGFEHHAAMTGAHCAGGIRRGAQETIWGGRSFATRSWNGRFEMPLCGPVGAGELVGFGQSAWSEAGRRRSSVRTGNAVRGEEASGLQGRG